MGPRMQRGRRLYAHSVCTRSTPPAANPSHVFARCPGLEAVTPGMHATCQRFCTPTAFCHMSHCVHAVHLSRVYHPQQHYTAWYEPRVALPRVRASRHKRVGKHNATCAARLTLTCKGWNGTTHTRSAGRPQLSTTHVPEAHTGACTFVRVAHTHHRWRAYRASGFERNAA